MLAIDGTAHESLMHRICIVETLSATQAAELPPAYGPPVIPTSTQPRLADPNFQLTQVRSDALAGLNAYQRDDWDCDGAVGITSATMKIAADVLSALPPTIPNPEVAPAADGSLCMEWNRGDTDLVWADVESDGSFLTLVKISGRKREKKFLPDEGKILKLHLANALARMYA